MRMTVYAGAVLALLLPVAAVAAPEVVGSSADAVVHEVDLDGRASVLDLAGTQVLPSPDAMSAEVLPRAATAAPAKPKTRTLVLERTMSGPASFRLTFDAQLSDQTPQGFVAVVSARVERNRVEEAVALGANAFYWDYGLRADSGEQVVEVCQPLGGCIVNRTLAYQSFTAGEDEGGEEVHNRLYVVIEGPGTVRFTGEGWVLRSRPLTYRWMESADAEGSGVLTGTIGVQHFESANLPGSKSGSIAVGTPPCSQARSGLAPRGVGTATLSGGTEPLSVTCPLNAGRPYLTSVSSGQTDWRLAGPVIGENTLANVPLFVLDVPTKP